MNPLTHQPDPYNYPMPNRADTMGLSVINGNRDGMYTHTKKFNSSRQWNDSLKTTDIAGAQPKLHGSKVVNKPDLSNQNWDIDRSGPRALHIGLNKPETNLTNQDIEGSEPHCVHFTGKRPYNNPLNPTYSLPKVEMRPITPPKFLRDSIAHDDIEGSKPKKVAYYKTRDIMQLDDIEGSRSKNLTNDRKAQYSNMDYKDVTHTQFKSKRSTNPLNPTYKVRNEDNKPMSIGEIDGNKPQGLPNRTKGDVSQSLSTKDIEGAMASTKGLGTFANRDRKHFRETNAVQDIPGSQVGSLKKAPVTQRISNPLNPEYVSPGDVEYKGTVRHAMDRVGETCPFKEPKERKTGPPKEVKPYVTYQKPLDTDTLNQDRNTFYGMPGHGPEIDVNKLYQAAKNQKQGEAPGVNKETQNNRDFIYNQKKFYAQSTASRSELEHAQKIFYADGGEAGSGQPAVNKHSQHFKRDQANFHMQSYACSDATSEKGSIFQGHAEEFYATGRDKKQKEPIHTKGQHYK